MAPGYREAPALTPWAAVVAERLGSPWEMALTVGQAVAGMTAHARGVRLGICAQPEERPLEPAPPMPEGATGVVRLRLYERFRPGVPADGKGWEARGVLDLARIEALAKRP